MTAAESWGWKNSSGVLGKIGRITEVFTGFFRSQEPLKRKITHIVIMIKEQQEKLDELLFRLEERGRDLFDKTVKAYVAKDMARATIYAGEVAEIRKIAKMVATTKLALEKVALRLETISQLGDAAMAMAPIAGLLQNLRNQIAGVVPEVAYNLDAITRDMNDIIMEAGITSERTLEITTVNDETRRILEEAKSVAELNVEERFPKLPATLEKLAESHVRMPIAVTIGGTQSTAPSVQSLENVEAKVLRYIQENKGFLDVAGCARKYGLPKESVLKAVENLKRKGKIKTK